MVDSHIPLIMKHLGGRHALSKPRKHLDYDDEHEAATLISLVPTDFDEACRVSERLIEKKGPDRRSNLNA